MLHSESEPRLYRLSRLLCGVFTHLLCAAFTVFVAIIATPGSSLFSWHPFLMTLAFSFFMTEAILLFSPHSSPALKWKHQFKARLHWLLQCSCVSCALLGFGTIVYNKQVSGKPHFSTWHGLLGLVTVCVVVLQAVAALPLIYHKLAKGWSLAKLKRYHAAAGLVTYLLGSASLLLGISSTWFSSSVGGNAWYVTALCPALAAFTIMSQVTNAYMTKKTPAVLEQEHPRCITPLGHHGDGLQGHRTCIREDFPPCFTHKHISADGLSQRSGLPLDRRQHQS